MGLQKIKIEFKEVIPSFQSIADQFKQQTGLNIEIRAVIHLASGKFGDIFRDSTHLVRLLHADATAVENINKLYKAKISSLKATCHAEEAAAIRDRAQDARRQFNHIERLEIVIGHSNFYPIEISVIDRTVIVNKYDNQHYAVNSFVKTLVDLGGIFLQKNEIQSSNRRLKKWYDYKWYNRPKR